jgi:hypothetical protein
MKVDQSSNAVSWGGRLIESDMACSANSKDLDIDSTIFPYLFFIICTKFNHFLSFDLSIGDVDVFSWDVDVIKKMIIHVVVIRFSVSFLDGIVLIQIKGDNVFKAELSIFVKFDKFLVYADRSTAGG